MIPILYQANEKEYTTNGIGHLTDAVSCIVSEEENGEYELAMEYPITGIHYEQLQNESIILAKPNQTDREQPFRVYRMSKPMAGVVTVNARHISYDLTGIPVNPFTATGAETAMQMLKTQSAVDNPFSFQTDIQSANPFTVETPQTIRAIMGAGEKSLLSVYGGVYAYDRFTVSLQSSRGENRGFKIRYGKNLIDLNQEENVGETYTGILPYYKGNTVITGPVVQAAGTFATQRVLPLDLSQTFGDTQPTAAQLQTAAQEYITKNKVGIPDVSLSVSFVQLSKSLEYQDQAFADVIAIGDTVTVEFEKLGISTTATVIKTVYDVLLERFESVGIGDKVTNVADTIAGIGSSLNGLRNDLNETPTATEMEQAIQSATNLITGVSGGSVVWGFDSSGKPTELFFLDTESVTTAADVLRINRNGIGFSTNGINGPFDTAWTIDGQFYAKYIVAKTIVAEKLADKSVPERAVDDMAISNRTIGGGAVSYGKTSFTGTLDQVGINQANIATINGYFTGSANFASLKASTLYIGNYRLVPGTMVNVDSGTRACVLWQNA